jgi:hypothetical protein
MTISHMYGVRPTVVRRRERGRSSAGVVPPDLTIQCSAAARLGYTYRPEIGRQIQQQLRQYWCHAHYRSITRISRHQHHASGSICGDDQVLRYSIPLKMRKKRKGKGKLGAQLHASSWWAGSSYAARHWFWLASLVAQASVWPFKIDPHRVWLEIVKIGKTV